VGSLTLSYRFWRPTWSAWILNWGINGCCAASIMPSGDYSRQHNQVPAASGWHNKTLPIDSLLNIVLSISPIAAALLGVSLHLSTTTSGVSSRSRARPSCSRWASRRQLAPRPWWWRAPCSCPRPGTRRPQGAPPRPPVHHGLFDPRVAQPHPPKLVAAGLLKQVAQQALEHLHGRCGRTTPTRGTRQVAPVCNGGCSLWIPLIASPSTAQQMDLSHPHSAATAPCRRPEPPHRSPILAYTGALKSD